MLPIYYVGRPLCNGRLEERNTCVHCCAGVLRLAQIMTKMGGKTTS